MSSDWRVRSRIGWVRPARRADRRSPCRSRKRRLDLSPRCKGKMGFGIFELPTLGSSGRASDEYRAILDEAVEIDRAGWDAIWLAEHHLDPYGGIVPSPAVLGAAVAMRTERLRLGVAIAVLPLHDPL